MGGATSQLTSGQWCRSWGYSVHTHTELVKVSHPPSFSSSRLLLAPLTKNRTLRPAATFPSTTSWWPRCHLKKSRLTAPSGRHALWSLIRSRLTNRQWWPECRVAYSRKGSSSELMGATTTTTMMTRRVSEKRLGQKTFRLGIHSCWG